MKGDAMGQLSVTRASKERLQSSGKGLIVEYVTFDKHNLSNLQEFSNSIEINHGGTANHAVVSSILFKASICTEEFIEGVYIEFTNGRNIYLYQSDQSDGIVIEYNTRGVMTNLGSRFDL